MKKERKMHNLHEDHQQEGKSSTVGTVEKTDMACISALTQEGILEMDEEGDLEDK